MDKRTLTILLLISVLWCGCTKSGSSIDYHSEEINFGNFTGQAVTVEYPAGVDEGFWEWEIDEVFYDSIEIEDGQSETLQVAIFDNDYDILKITLFGSGAEFFAPEIWRECVKIDVYYHPDFEQIEYEMFLY